MQTTMTRWMMIAAAALAVAAGSASAQTESYTVQIPMSFHAGESVMAPGSYLIRVATGGPGHLVSVHNLDTRQTVMVVPGAQSDAPKKWRQEGAPKLGFQCSGEDCALSSLWNGRDTFAYSLPSHRPVTMSARTEVVTLAITKAR